MKFIYVVEDTREHKVAFTNEEKARNFYINLLRKTIKKFLERWCIERWEVQEEYEYQRLENHISDFCKAKFYPDRDDCWFFGFDPYDNDTYCRIYSIPIAD